MPDRHRAVVVCALTAVTSTVLLTGPLASAAVRVFRHAEIRPVAAPPIADGALVIEDGLVRAVGASAEIPTPDGAEEFDLTGRVVIPGMVDTHSHIGGPTDPGREHARGPSREPR